jgi:hypothetical protein
MPVRTQQSALCTVGVKEKRADRQAENMSLNSNSMDMFKRMLSSCMNARKHSVK